MAPLKLGILGCGSITERGLLPHLSTDHGRSLATVTALADLDEARVARLARRYGVSVAATSLPELLTTDVDGVVVATPIQHHQQNVRTALLARKHVYCQKPLASVHSAAVELAELSDARELVLACSPGRRLLPVYRRAQAILSSGDLGAVYHYTCVNTGAGHETEAPRSGDRSDPRWYYQPGASPMADMGIYALHAAMALFGPPSEVAAFTSRPMPTKPFRASEIPVESDDNMAVLLKHDGVLGTITTAFAEHATRLDWGHLAVSASQGALEVWRGDHPTQYELTVRTRSRTWHEGPFGHDLPEPNDSMQEAHVYRDLVDFCMAVSEGQPLANPISDAVLATATLEAVTTSVQEQRSIEIPTR